MNAISRRSALVSSAAVAAGLAIGGRPGRATASPVRESPAVNPPWVGTYAGQQAGNPDPQALWDRFNTDLGGGQLTYRRSFVRTIPAVGNEAWREADAPGNFYSMKPPNGDVDGYIAGAYDDRLRAVVRELPANTKLAIFHEPENDMSGQKFHRLTQQTVDVTKGEREDVEVWYVAMAYQWETNSKGHVGSNAGWIDAARIVDAVGIDVYAPAWDFTAVQDDKGFKRWWNALKTPSGKPWGIIERGIVANNGETARIDTLRKDWAYAKANQATAFLYWNADWDENMYQLDTANELAAYRAFAREGRQP